MASKISLQLLQCQFPAALHWHLASQEVLVYYNTEVILFIRCFPLVIMLVSVFEPCEGTGIYQWGATTLQA